MVNDSSLSHMYEKAAYIKLFGALVGHNLLLEANPPFFTILAATTQRLQDVGMTKEAVIGKALFEAHPGNTTDPTDNGVPNLRSSLDHVLRYKEVHQLAVQRYDLPDEQGGFSEKYWRASNRPVLNEEGEVAYIIHTAEDITHEIKAKEQAEKIKGLEQAYGLFMQAPFAIHIFTGPDLVIDLANPPTLELWGKTEDVTGKRFLDVLPELKGQGYDVIMQEVMQTGTPRFFYEVPLALNRPGKDPLGYFNFVYQPYYKEGALKAGSVLIIANEVTQQVLAKKSIEESEARLKVIVEQTPAPTLVLRGDDFIVEHINHPMLRMMGRGDEVIGHPFLSLMPELEGQFAWEQVKKVYHQGIPFDQEEVLVAHKRNGVLQDHYYTVAYRPLKEEDRITGMIQVAIDVTEQVTARKMLEESESRFRALVTASSDVMYSMNADWTIMNPLDGRGFLSNAAAPVKNWMEKNVHPAEYETVKKTIAAAIANKTVFELEHRVVTVDGSTGWTFSRAIPLLDNGGNIVEWFGAASDITARKMAEQSLKQSESRFRNVINTTPVGTAILTGPHMKVEVANEVILKFWQRDGSVISKPLTEAIPELIGQPFPELLATVYNTGITHTDNAALAYFLNAEGALVPFYFNYSCTALRESDGAIYGVLIMAVDVTEEMLSKNRLEESEARFRTLVQEAPVAMFIFRGENMVISTANKMALEMIGRTQEAVGKPLLEAIPELTGSPAYKVFQEVYTTGQAQYGHAVLVPLERNGQLEKCYFNFAYTPLVENGKVVGVMDVATEVTDMVLARKKIEEVVVQRTKELGEANKTLHEINNELQRSNHHLEEFAHAASHDLKEPVRKITFFTSQLKDQLDNRLKEGDVRLLARITNATERMGSLIDDLLLYSHVSQRPHEKELVDLSEKVHRVLEDLELDIQEKAAVINVEKLLVVKGYGRQLQQLFQNLISNALKYSKADVPPQINIGAAVLELEGKKYNVIHVQDNGIGFEPEYADKIFQMFTRLHGKGEYSGTGVGLSIVKKVVENHHGFIKVKSAPGEGSTFEIYLPL